MSATSIQIETIPSGTYNVDPAHSSVGFEVRHMGIATVRGAFKKFEGTVEAGDQTVLKGQVEVSSIDTGDAQRDAHLAAPDFFDAGTHPTISFHSTGAEAAGEGQVRLTGDITIKGITKPIELTGIVADAGTTDPWGNERVGLELEGTIDRREFDLKWNQTLPNGNLLVANQVKLVVSVSAVKAS